MRHVQKLAYLAAAGCTLALLPACTAAVESTPPATPPQATASAATSPAGVASAGTRPAATSKPSTTKRPAWSTVNWASLTFDALNCPRLNGFETADVDSVHYFDLTRDGLAEAVVAASCRTTTARNPISVFVYDGTDRSVPLKRLLTVGVHQYLVTATVSAKGSTLSLTSKALSDDAPRCCPDLLITQRYTWDGSRFAGTFLDQRAI